MNPSYRLFDERGIAMANRKAGTSTAQGPDGITMLPLPDRVLQPLYSRFLIEMIHCSRLCHNLIRWLVAHLCGRKWVSSVTPRILGILFSGATVSPIRTWGWSRDWWVSDVKFLTISPPHQNGAELIGLGPHIGLHNAGSRSQWSEVVGVGHHVIHV